MASEIPSPDAVLHLAALHTLASAGFASTSRAASATLSTTLARYLRVVALACTDRATQAGRQKVAAIDVVQALEDLGVGGIGELHEWTVDLDQEITFRDAGLSELGEALRDGLETEEQIAEMKFIPDDELSEDEDEGSENDDREMDVDVNHSDVQSFELSLPETNLSWLPSLPSDKKPTITTTHIDHSNDQHTIPSSTLSISERYRKRIPYSQSTLASSREFAGPPFTYPFRALPPPPTSFPLLVDAFNATAGEPSIALRQNHLRHQASELLQRFVAPPEAFSPQDTLVSPLPPPRTTPIIPSHSETIPPHPLSLNPDPQSHLLSSLVHQMQTPHLPPALRERLTSIRPPLPLQRDNKPILYGEPIRGPGMNALARAKGKQLQIEDADGDDEGLSRATWDSGPRGIEKWGKGIRLTAGKKIVQAGQGEFKPREPPGRKRDSETMIPKFESPASAETPNSSGGGGGGSRLKLRLSTGGINGDGSISPATGQRDGPSPTPPTPAPANPNHQTPTRTLTINGGGIRMKLGGLKRLSTDATGNIVKSQAHLVTPQTPGDDPAATLGLETPFQMNDTTGLTGGSTNGGAGAGELEGNDTSRTFEASQRLAEAQSQDASSLNGSTTSHDQIRNVSASTSSQLQPSRMMENGDYGGDDHSVGPPNGRNQQGVKVEGVDGITVQGEETDPGAGVNGFDQANRVIGDAHGLNHEGSSHLKEVSAEESIDPQDAVGNGSGNVNDGNDDVKMEVS